MSQIPPIQVKVTADTTGLDAGLKTAQDGIKKVDDSVKTASTGMSSFMGNLKKLGATMGVVFAGKEVAQFAKDAVLAASTMNESVSKVQVVFGETSDEVLKFGKTAATSMGISNQKAIEAAGTYGNLLQAVGLTQAKSQEMSTTMVQLAADLASFNNTSVDDALNALRSGLSGETEPLKRFGVALNDVTLKNKALAMGLIETTSGVLPPAIKAQATYALVMEQTKLAQGDYARTSEGTANTIKTLQAKFADASVAVGNMLLPALNLLLKISAPIVAGMEKMATFINENKNALAVFVGIISAATVAWGAYTVVTKRAAIQQAILNGIMAINPIGAIVVAVAALAAGLVVLWNKNETFRKGVISVAKAALTAFATIIPMIGKVGEAYLKFLLTPMKLFLEALSHLPKVGKYAQAGLDVLNKGLNGVSDFADGAAKKANSLIAKLDGMGAAAEKSAAKTKKAVAEVTGSNGSGGAGGGTDKKTADKISSIMRDAQDKMADALENYHEKTADARARYEEQVADATKRSREMDAEANKRYNETILDINKDYAAKEIELRKDVDKRIADLKETAAAKSLELTKQAAEKQDNIIKQSIDRLRNAFASGTAFSIADAFKGKGAGSFLDTMKKQLADAKALQEGAAYLSGQGYAQTFIEEVVKAGPTAGLDMINELKKASPEQQRVIQDTFMDLESIQETGLDSLAKSMNNGANLATSQLREAYDQVAVDLKESLASVDMELTKSLAEANANYADAMATAKVVRDERIAEADKDLMEALTKSKVQLDEALAEASATLQKSLTEAQKNYEKAIDDINAATTKKLTDLKVKLAEVASLMAQLQSAQAAAASMASASITPAYSMPTPTLKPGDAGFIGPVATTTVNQNFISNAAPSSYDVMNAVVAGTKYGQAVVPTVKSTPSISTAQGTANKLKAMGLL